MASLRETIHLPQGYLSGASSITKSEPTGKPAGPHDLAFDELIIGDRFWWYSKNTSCSEKPPRIGHFLPDQREGATFGFGVDLRF